MTDMERLKDGLVRAISGLDDILSAEEDSEVHFLTKTEYGKIEEMIKTIHRIYCRTRRD